MISRNHRFSIACAAVTSFVLVVAAGAQEPQVDRASLPAVKFFYYDTAGVEWAVSAEPEGLQQHLASSAESRTLLESVSSAVASAPEANDSDRQMTRWIETERRRFEQSRREAARIRMAEGIIAYLRANDFSITKLVEELKRRSGASATELVAIHVRDRQGNPSFKLKVVLVDPDIDVGKQGFNIDLPSPSVGYATVAYALGVALYEVQEIIHSDSPTDTTDGNKATEELPVPASARKVVPLKSR